MADTPILMAGYTTEPFTNQTGEVLVSRSQPLYDLFTRAPLSGYAAKLNDTRNPISHFVVVSGGDAIQVRQNVTPIAHECILSVSKPSPRNYSVRRAQSWRHIRQKIYSPIKSLTSNPLVVR